MSDRLLPLPAVRALAARARERGARVILNAAPVHSRALSLLPSIDVLVVNEIEADAMRAQLDAGATAEAFAIHVHRRFGCAVVVTLGAKGAFAVAGETLICASAPVLRVIDTTGAGDAFTGALAAALHSGTPWNRALAMGVAAGSLACAETGAQAALPATDAIDALAATVEANLVQQRLG